ncbi:MAG: hypothetical protein PWR07_1124 [Bacillota bacterium]|nr:hypothetical protein [Bacillota bacterium]
MDFQPIDAGLVPLVIAAVETVKKYVNKRWIPLLPWPFAFVACALAVLGQGWQGWPEFLARTLVETAKVAFASMGLYKIAKTTIFGQ